MRNGFARDWKLGVLAHFICDYCCMAHNEQYYDLYKHRVYEVLSQQVYEKLRYGDAFNNILMEYGTAEYDLTSFETAESEAAFKDALSQMIEHYLRELHSRIEGLECYEWHRDERVVCLDIAYAYALLGQFLKAMA